MTIQRIPGSVPIPSWSPLRSSAAFVSLTSTFSVSTHNAVPTRNACFGTTISVAVTSHRRRIRSHHDTTYMAVSIPNNDPSDPIIPVEIQIHIDTKTKTKAQDVPTIQEQLLLLNQRKQTSKFFRVREATWQDLRRAARICAKSFSNSPTRNTTETSTHKDVSKQRDKAMVIPLPLPLPLPLSLSLPLTKAQWDRFVLECVALEIYLGFAIRFLFSRFTIHRIFIAETCSEDQECLSGDEDEDEDADDAGVGNKRKMVGVLELSVLQPDNALYPNPQYKAVMRQRRLRQSLAVSGVSPNQDDRHRHSVAQVAEDIVPLSNETPFVYIQNVAVDSRFRRKGVAQLLMNYCERAVMYQLNKKAVYLHFEMGNEAAQKLYSSLGYQVLGKDGHTFASTFRLARRAFAGKLLL
mmetsp:Transcript_14062/g.24040  ORF Transcript_14062/g.24040 Transcript_14062/m.24040 type:complete len:409 (-) Transcript_14062:146-1372(-)|eukprot:CAMPEP_0184708568 /NCGR_PEP_ID=MMETSP0313-20130426/37844_1 /TAXON_ID=2792 /ORGANISM="Porphyridium aerugineum, Strain SAG 1380-2" /LENGTH=408 /DNA_ID=CAMNT_0027170165 /DNA_START=1069 /DNA_END=2295 /DNA_ORIENTATION=-